MGSGQVGNLGSRSFFGSKTISRCNDDFCHIFPMIFHLDGFLLADDGNVFSVLYFSQGKE